MVEIFSTMVEMFSTKTNFSRKLLNFFIYTFIKISSANFLIIGSFVKRTVMATVIIRQLKLLHLKNQWFTDFSVDPWFNISNTIKNV